MRIFAYKITFVKLKVKLFFDFSKFFLYFARKRKRCRCEMNQLNNEKFQIQKISYNNFQHDSSLGV